MVGPPRGVDLEENLYRLYPRTIVDGYLHMDHMGEQGHATASATEENTVCGDELTVYLNVSDGIITSANYKGKGCVICLGAAEMSAARLRGMDATQVVEMENSNICALLGVNIKPSRLRCANLFMRAAKEAVRAMQVARASESAGGSVGHDSKR